MNDLKPNSHRFKEEQAAEERQKKTQKIIKGTAKTRKKSELAKLGDVFISEDVSSVKSYVLMDILVPAIKKAISDIVTNGIDMILYGESGRREKRTGSSNYVSYRDYSKRDRDERRPDDRRNSLGYDNIVLDSRGEAEMVLEQMVDMIDQYDEVSVADLYDMVDLTAPYTANKYGWTNLRDASVVRTRDGYAFKLPRAKPL